MLRLRAAPPQHHPLPQGAGYDQGRLPHGVFVDAVSREERLEI